MDDSTIVNLFLERNEAAIGAVKEKYGAALRSVAMRILGDAGAAEECEFDAYLEAWNRIPPHEPRTYLFAFLARIARASALNRAKALGREKRSAVLVELTEELESVLPSPCDTAGEAEAAELSRLLNGFLKKLGDEKRAVFVQRYWYALSVKEIAERYSMSEGKVKSVLFRTRNELKKYLKKEGFIL